MDSSGRLAGWQWMVLTILWLPGPVVLLWGEYPRAETWRQEFLKQRLLSIESERVAAYGRLVAQCQTGDKYDLISPRRRVEYLRCMDGRKGEQDALDGAYLKATAAVNAAAEQSVRDDLPRAQWRVIGKGVALWLVPLLALYALGLAVERLRGRFRR